MEAALVNAIHALRCERDAKDSQAQLLELIYVEGNLASLMNENIKLKMNLRQHTETGPRLGKVGFLLTCKRSTQP